MHERPRFVARKIASLMAGAVGSAALFATPAFAQDADQSAQGDIVVTATKTGATRLQDTPIAISAYSGDVLAQQGVRDIRDIAQLAPNLAISENTSFSQVFIRGIGSNNAFAGSDPSSTVHMDGIYLARPVSYFNSFLDVERVEVLRGPQGTLYGRNSVGGTINIISRKPTEDTHGRVELGYGNYNQRQVGFYVNGKLADGWSASLAGLYSAHDAYIKNINPTGNDIDDDDLKGVRGQIRYNGGAADIVVRADYLKQTGAITSYSKLLEERGSGALSDTVLGDYQRIANNYPHDSDREAYGVMADATFDLGGDFKLKSLSSYRHSYFRASFDTDASSVDLLHTKLAETQHQFSQELNLIGRAGPLAFVLGAYYFTETIDFPLAVQNVTTGIESYSTPHVYTRNFAFFQQSDLKLSDTLTATFGLRYSKEIKDFTQYQAPRSVATGAVTGTITRYTTSGEYEALTPKFALEWRPIEDVLAYASISRGFKSGGFVNSGTNPQQGFGPEKLWAYEGGIKTSWLDRKLQLNMSLFYYKYDDLQVSFFLVPGVTDIRNAATAMIKGAEFEFRALPFEGTTIEGNVSLLDAEYDKFLAAPLRNNTGSFDASGNKLNDAPPYTVNIAWGQRFPEISGWGPSLRIEGSWNGRRYFTPQNTLVESQGAYFLLNSALTLTAPGDRLSVTLWGRNLTDKQYVTGTGSFAAQRVAGRPGFPRTYGVKVGYKF